MPCITLLLETQHSDLIEAAETLARSAGADGETWPGDLLALRRMLERHDRMEQEVLARLGVPQAPEALSEVFDGAVGSQQPLASAAVAAAARETARLIEAHADQQEAELFPALKATSTEALRHQLGDGFLHMDVGPSGGPGTT